VTAAGVAASLVLAVIQAPAGVAPERRTVTGGAFTIGRGAGSDWVLPDPDKVLSKQHCEITVQNSNWAITDCSSNGTSVNGNRLDADQMCLLRDKDRVTVGAYEIEVRFEDAPPSAVGRTLIEAEPHEPGEERLTSDPFAMPADDPLHLARPGIGLPADFEPLFADEGIAENRYTAPNHVSDLRENFQLPRPSLELLPADWDADDAAGQPGPPAAAPVPPAPPSVAPLAAATTDQAAADAAGLSAFIAGAGIQGAPAGDPNAALRGLGAAFRAVVSGLRRVMIARAAIKGEFRIEQTMVQAAGNNPLKFSADDDDALSGLLGIGRNAGMTPERALADSLRDMRLHELAVAAAMQQAVRGMLADLAPERITRDLLPGLLDGVLGRRKRRAWDAYERRHAATMRALSDDFDSVFGKSFVRAYEAALASVHEQDLGTRP